MPKKIVQNILFRQTILNDAIKNVFIQQSLKRACAENILFFINVFVISMDTRKASKKGTITPFITFLCQDDAIKKIVDCILPPPGKDQRDLAVKKSRDMGATWCFVIVFVWILLFHKERCNLFMMSYREEEVDGGDDSLFGKVDFLLDCLPSWLKPIPGAKGHGLTRTRMWLVNEATGSSLRGASSSSKSGVGGRYLAMLFDECQLIDEMETLWTKSHDCSNARIVNGTPNGTHTQFFRIIHDAEKDTDPSGTEIVRLHWQQHPWKAEGLYTSKDGNLILLDGNFVHPENYVFILDGKVRSPWYDYQCRRRGFNEQAIAQELDIDFYASGGQFFNAGEIYRLMDKWAKPPRLVGTMAGGKFIANPQGNLRLWCGLFGDSPPPGRYGIAADVAMGSQGPEATPSCLSIVNLETGEKVGELEDRTIEPSELARQAAQTGTWFYDAKIIWESNGPGALFRKTLMGAAGYRNVYFKRTGEKGLAEKVTDEPGWNSSPGSKLVLLNDYRGDLTTGAFMNPSKPALEECLKFVYDGATVVHSHEKTKTSGERARHGDKVVADALANLLVKQEGVVEQEGGKPEEREPPVGSLAWRDKYLGYEDDEDDDMAGW